MGKANGSRECAPENRLRVPTIQDDDLEIDGGHGAIAPLPTLVIAQSIIVGMFREEWPAAVCTPRLAAGDRIEPTQSS